MAPLAQENNPDQQCTGHAQSPVGPSCFSGRLILQAFRAIAPACACAGKPDSRTEVPNTLSIRCCPDNSESRPVRLAELELS
ncbi:hypothetical protein F4W67_02000 [Pseudomonas caricapapayae]|nr:hypothetical protein F4W67_02000 [Pseudomonas caricapapayae]